jgi:hypothetical protein
MTEKSLVSILDFLGATRLEKAHPTSQSRALGDQGGGNGGPPRGSEV